MVALRCWPAALPHVRRSLSTRPSVRFLPPALEEKVAGNLPAAVETTVPVPSTAGTRLISLIVCRDSPTDTLKAFENNCPHQAGKLFLNPDGHLQCRLHGAKFYVKDGKCFDGPCTGSRLSILAVDELYRGQITTTVQALTDLWANGSGGTAPRKNWQPSAKAQDVMDAFAGASRRS